MSWDPWSGCYAASDGCKFCYYYGPYSKRYGQNTVAKTLDFTKPLAKNAKGAYKMAGGKTVATCFTTDFFLPEADEWRAEAWAMIRARPDLEFMILTKRIDRFHVALPADWGDGYENVYLGCTVEDQATTDYRLPQFLAAPIRRRFIACSPLLGAIDLAPYLHGVEQVSVNGESGKTPPKDGATSTQMTLIDSDDAPQHGFVRECDLAWVRALYDQCREQFGQSVGVLSDSSRHVFSGAESGRSDLTFWFKGTGALLRVGDTVERVNPFKQTSRAREILAAWHPTDA